MTNRRFDLIYILAFLLVLGLGYLAAERDDADDGPEMVLPEFALPSIDLEAPFDLPYVFVRYARPEPPRLVLAESMESAMVEVRTALLESSAPIEVRDDTQLAARGE